MMAKIRKTNLVTTRVQRLPNNSDDPADLIMSTATPSLYQQFNPARALSLTEANVMGEQEILSRLSIVFRQFNQWSVPSRSQILQDGAGYLEGGVRSNPLTGESHRCVWGNFGFWSHWMRDELVALACTLHVIRLTDEEFSAMHSPKGHPDNKAALAAMRATTTAIPLRN